MSILLALQRAVKDNGANALKDAIVTNLTHHGGLLGNQFAEKLVCFGADGISVFQRINFRVTTQLKEQCVPFMFGMQYVAHRTNLAVQPILNVSIVEKLESLC